MSAHASIRGDCRPAVAQNHNVCLARIHHGLDGDYHAGAKFHALSGFAKVRHLWIFVHVDTDAVAHKIPYYRKTRGFNHLLHREAYITQRCTRVSPPQSRQRWSP